MRRWLGAVAIAAAMIGCQRAGDPAEESARRVAASAPVAAVTAVTVRPAAAQAVIPPAPIAMPARAEQHSCGGACGASCSGSCGAGCAMGAPAASTAPVPKDAEWAALQVDGMMCGGCARRIQGRLAQLDGVVGSEVDLATHTVRVAVVKGVDARAIAAPAIDELGYHVR